MVEMQKRTTAAASPHLPDFRWDDARVLLALVRERSLKRAAGRLGIDAATVGRRLDALESALDLHLFDRGPDGMRPTSAAEELLPLAEDLERAALALGRVRAGIESTVEGVVRITAPPGLADQLLVPLLPGLIARHPALRIEIDASIRYADLTRREADLALRGVRPSSGDLVAQKLGAATARPHGSKDLVRRLGKLRSFAEVPFITWADDLAHLPDARFLAAHVPAERLVLRTSAMATQIAAARAGLGAVFLPDVFQASTGLVPLELAPSARKLLADLPESDLWLIGHAAYRRVPRIAAVWEFLRDEITNERLMPHAPSPRGPKRTTATKRHGGSRVNPP